tara:strand:- start:1090 stop:1956 length:867 start_codon:yes stop_codon:yes gene_type:complete
MNKLNSFYVVPAQTFFKWGFTIPKNHYSEYIKYFDFKEGNLVQPIKIKIDNKIYSAKARMARINNQGTGAGRSDRVYPVRDVVQIFYNKNYDTLKALRKLFIYSYATTIDLKSKPELKELLEFIHVKDDLFRIKAISKQKTDFDAMFRFMEDKNLFSFWKKEMSGSKKTENIFLDFSKKWISADKAHDYASRSNCIYLLFHTNKKKIYIGKANVFGDRVKKGQGRVGLDKDWDKCMYFEINPQFAMFLEQIEMFSIRLFASIIENEVGIKELKDKSIKLVNRQLKTNK